jgi:hypothetical protein
MGENPAGKDELRRARLGAALRENLKRRKAQARGRDGKPSDSESLYGKSAVVPSSGPDSVDDPRPMADKFTGERDG